MYVRRGSMIAVDYKKFNENMNSFMDKVVDEQETLIVTRKGNKNVVILSEDVYNNMMENIYVLQDKTNYDWLMESVAQLEDGKFSVYK